MRAPTKADQVKQQPKLEVPFTKEGWRYYLCEDDYPLNKELMVRYDNTRANPKMLCPVFLKRKVIQPVVRLSENDRAPQLKLSDDNLKVVGEKGYSMVRSTHGVNRGKWFFEVLIEDIPAGSAARIGYSQKYANLQAPLGYDEFGYSYRSRLGTKFHQAKGKTFDEGGGYQAGDYIGCLIELPF